MEHLAPLIQTVLWVGLIGVALWKFHVPLYGLLVALQRRIEAGSNLKAGPFEISDQLKPQDLLKQQQKAAAEVEEAIQAAEPAAEASPEQKEALKAKYFQAEDLVLRAIQAEYGATISREVTAGADMGFDGAFVTNGRLNIVEVKYLSGPSGNVSRLQPSVERLASTVARYGWSNAQIILAVVFEKAEEVPRGIELFKRMTGEMATPVVVRCFSLTELQARFGVGDGVNGLQVNRN